MPSLLKNGFGSGQTGSWVRWNRGPLNGLGMTAMIAKLLGGCVFAGIASGNRKADLVGQGIRHCLPRHTPQRRADQTDGQQHRQSERERKQNRRNMAGDYPEMGLSRQWDVSSGYNLHKSALPHVLLVLHHVIHHLLHAQRSGPSYRRCFILFRREFE